MDNFEYEPIDLERPSIRLLRLFQGTNGPIQCELFNGWLYEEVIEYEALSYTWGGILKPREIELDGKQFPVTDNLFLALEHLRHPYQDRIMWIDAICIDQENLKERGHQVQQMGSIYSQAEQVVIWLGMSTLGTDALMDSLQYLHTEYRNSGSAQWMPTDPRWLELWMKVQPKLAKEYFDLENLQRQGWKTLSERPWFRRVWILQEVANAKRATIYIGTKSASARVFGFASTLMGVRTRSHVQVVLDIMPGPSREISWWSQNRELYTLLKKFRRSKASDKRDMVYALLGIASDFDSHRVLADYTKSMNELLFHLHIYWFGGQGSYCQNLSEFLSTFPLLNEIYFRTRVPSWTADDAAAFLDLRGNDLYITNEVLRTVTMNPNNGTEIMALLLKYGEDMAHGAKSITHDIGDKHREVAVLLMRVFSRDPRLVQMNHPESQSDAFFVLISSFSTWIMALLLDHNFRFVITEEILNMIAQNPDGKALVVLLLGRIGGYFPRTEKIAGILKQSFHLLLEREEEY